MNSYDFNIEDMLKFDGERTYVMYTNSRMLILEEIKPVLTVISYQKKTCGRY